jgi:hypothetical protein
MGLAACLVGLFAGYWVFSDPPNEEET